jgi:hypothetical protein
MTNVSALRTEIKTWERNFRAEHGREPSVQDIKEQPGLGTTFRVYHSAPVESSTSPEVQGLQEIVEECGASPFQ